MKIYKAKQSLSISFTKPLMILAITLSISGCGTIGNLIVGPEQGFRDHIDSRLGLNIHEVINPRTDGKGVGEVKSVTQLDDSFDEYLFSYWIDGCLWAGKVERSTGQLKSWRYVSDASLCKRDKFYSGAW